jgi:hypothetical protein
VTSVRVLFVVYLVFIVVGVALSVLVGILGQ